MRGHDPLPAWAARQRSRRLTRHRDEKVVRWISQLWTAKKRAADARSESAGAAQGREPSSNDNTITLTAPRTVRAV